MKNYQFIITTDSGCDLSKEMCDSQGIIPLFMNYTDGEDTYTDKMVNAETVKFYNQMREGKVFKTTSVNINTAYAFFKDLLKYNLPILHISLGSGISGTYSNCLQAKNVIKEENPDANIYVLDSTLASLGYGMIVLEAAEMRNANCSFEEVIDYLEQTKKGVNPYFTTNTLTYLCRGGRVTKTAKIFGNVLSIRPILRLDHLGKLLVHTKGHGKKNTMDKMIEEIKKQVVEPEKQIIYIAHSDDINAAVEYGERLMKEVGFSDVLYTYIGSIIGSHTGPGLVACFFHGKPRFE